MAITGDVATLDVTELVSQSQTSYAAPNAILSTAKYEQERHLRFTLVESRNKREMPYRRAIRIRIMDTRTHVHPLMGQVHTTHSGEARKHSFL